jgi:Zinc carboxypeptidase
LHGGDLLAAARVHPSFSDWLFVFDYGGASAAAKRKFAGHTGRGIDRGRKRSSFRPGPWVSYVPASASVPSPRALFGRIMGAPSELVDSSKAYSYCRALAAASPRVCVFTIEKSEERRDILLLAIADKKRIAGLEQLKAATAALADPRETDPVAAEKLIPNSRPMIRRIRENLVVLINPVSNPDGQDKQVEWFYRYLKGKNDRNTLPRQAPPYWGKYVYVDINRDSHQLTQEPTKAVSRMLFEWHPTVIHDLHEGLPLLMT